MTDEAERLLQFKSRGTGGTVRISLPVLEKLLLVQANLPKEVQLVVTRGLEETSGGYRLFHWTRRKVGAALFLCLFPLRAKEVNEIFSANGHNESGFHVDISIVLEEKLLNFLPLGVFTPLFILRRRKARYSSILRLVRDELAAVGFNIHPNEIEAAQIHCDYPSLT